MEFWNNIYSQFDPIAFSIGSINVHWYSLMYVLALLSSLWIAKIIVVKDNYPLNKEELDSYFLYAEIGVILGARIGYILFYDPHTSYYLTHPWQMFNPFLNGEFIGIRGMSYHGAMIGFLLATYIYSRRFKKDILIILDLVAIAIPLGYVFGRIGNFLNKELFGRESDSIFGIYVDGVLRHPSQLYEAFLEGVVVFIIVYFYRTKKRFNGELIAIYGFSYGVARFIAEFFREPDFHLGFIFAHLSMGQLLSLIMIGVSVGLYKHLDKKVKL